MFFAKKHPKTGVVYAITTGIYAGQLFVYMEKKDKEYSFLSIPEMITRKVPEDKFDVGLKHKIIDIVERLPNDVYTVCVKQYRKNQTVNK